MRKFLCILFFSISITGFSQETYTDSLTRALAACKSDTQKVNILNTLFLTYEFTDVKKAGSYLDQAITLARKSRSAKHTGQTYIFKGYFAEDAGKMGEAIEFYLKALEQFNLAKNKKGIADSYNFIGIIYSNQSNHPQALNYFYKSLKLKETSNDTKGLGDVQNNIGLVYANQKKYDLALRYYKNSLTNYTRAGSKTGIATTTMNLGLVMRGKGDNQKALEHYNAALEIYILLQDEKAMTNCYNNIGNIFAETGNHSKALENYFAALNIREKFGDVPGIASCYINIGSTYLEQKKNAKAEDYLRKAEKLSLSVGYWQYLSVVYDGLTELHKQKNDYKSALAYQKLAFRYRDSIDNEDTRKKTTQNELAYEFEKKKAVARADQKQEFKHQQFLQEEKSRKETIVLVLASAGFLVIALLAIFILRSLRTARSQKKIIEAQKEEVVLQKHIVEQKQQEIIDSIQYAKRIQQSLLPSERTLSLLFKRIKKQ
ncbi:MAG TPA: tetratricopeptide repeat protein [Flavobacteriales bacterium]|nr:tetratricopeptide repeat protein [Flavobacteriales bacterium]